MSEKDAVPSALRTKVIARWREINKTRAGLDFDLGALGADVRAKHVTGASGDYQTRSWFVKNLEVGVSTARKFLTAAQAASKFNRAQWEILGGWQTVQFVMHLPPAAHKKVLARAETFFNRHRRPMSYGQTRDVAFELGYRSRVRGRPLRSETEEKLNTLRSWLDTLYSKFGNLTDMTEEVQTAMRGTRLRDTND